MHTDVASRRASHYNTADVFPKAMLELYHQSQVEMLFLSANDLYHHSFSSPYKLWDIPRQTKEGSRCRRPFVL